MFGLFKRKKVTESNTGQILADVARELFSQVENARDDAKTGGLLDEKTFNDRLNNMYVAGYLVGYVDAYVNELFADNPAKKKYAEQVFEKMFPGVGADFVRAKVLRRKNAAAVDQADEQYEDLVDQCRLFDKGMDEALAETATLKRQEDYRPSRLKEFLLLGEV